MKTPYGTESVCLLIVFFTLTAPVNGQEIGRVANPPGNLANLPGDLRTIPIPKPASLSNFIKDDAAAIRLGKALFWDMQVGSDGIQACASCHFRAGADPRSKNQLSPGLKSVPDPDLGFSESGPNYQLWPQDFPFRRLSNPADRASSPVYDNNDVVASQGIHFLASADGGNTFLPDPLGFRVGPSNTRRVEPRNTPTIINAVFNHRNFWDGRAENVFNGVNHLGDRDPSAKVIRATKPSAPTLVSIRLENSSLASQAVAPIVSALEMARPGRTTLASASNWLA